MITKKNIYLDMDGVLADFNGEPDGLKRFRKEKGFFKNLKPLTQNVQIANKLLADGKYQVFILSASPNKKADGDKIEWVKQYLPKMQTENIIICRLGQKKLNFMKTADGILFDDYGKNLREWVDGNVSNNMGFKVRADGSLKIGLETLQLIWYNMIVSEV